MSYGVSRLGFSQTEEQEGGGILEQKQETNLDTRAVGRTIPNSFRGGVLKNVLGLHMWDWRWMRLELLA